ncbi:MAG: extracellular solute-binding protein [Lactobacillus sp.]|nr:extracellular solute-binding protein [Lactobacillus sp.]
MKLFKTTAILSVAAAGLLLAGCSNNNQKAEKVQTKISKTTTITFWNAMVGPSQTKLESLTKQFEKENPKIKVKLQYQGTYEDIRSKVLNTLQSPNNLPTIAQGYAGYFYTPAVGGYLVDLKPYIENSTVGWGSVKNSKILPDLLKGAQVKGVQYGMPFNKSVEVLYYNKTLFNKYGVKVPKTMAQMKAAAEKIYKKSGKKVVGAGFDNLSAYYANGMKDEGQNFDEKIDFNGAASKKVIHYYADGIKAGYFMIAGSQKYLSAPFASQQVAMYVSSSAGESFVKQGLKGKFSYGVTNRPSTYNMPRGADLFMFKHASAAQKTAAFKYMKFLASKKSQISWAKATGYVPVNEDALTDPSYTKTTEIKSPAIVQYSMKHLYNIPSSKNSEYTFRDVNAILENILSQAKTKNVDSLIKAGKAKFDSDWKQ